MLAWSVGEVLWDVFPDQERFGGAALNFCANLQRLGDRATLVSAVGHDERGRKALERMNALGLTTEQIRQVEGVPTGIATVSTGPGGEPAYLIPRPAAFDHISLTPETFAQARSAAVDWLYFGTLLQTTPEVERGTTALAQHLRPAKAFYDMNLRPGQWNLPLVQRLSHLASIMKLNEIEAETLFSLTSPADAVFSLESFCAGWAATYSVDVMCVTLGPAGCFIYVHSNNAVHRIAGYQVSVSDTVGSGDAFAAAFLHGFHLGWPIPDTARFANALGALVASRAGATPDWTEDEILALIQAN
jgi:fructokinase